MDELVQRMVYKGLTATVVKMLPRTLKILQLVFLQDHLSWWKDARDEISGNNDLGKEEGTYGLKTPVKGVSNRSQLHPFST